MRSLRRDPGLLWLAIVVAVGIALRLVFLYSYRPAFYGFPDSSVYLSDAAIDPFLNGSRPAGYGRFIAALHAVWPRMVLIPLVQHAIGLLTGVVLFVAVRRLGAPSWVAVVGAAAVCLGGSQLFLEHAVMAETLFTFSITIALLAMVEAGRAGRAPATLAWAALAGVAIAIGTTLRLPALFVAPVLAVWLLLAARSAPRQRVAAVAMFVAVSAAGVLGYMAWYDAGTGHFGLTRTGFYNSYARVATFADCTRFTPPAGTAKLCPKLPVERREGHESWIFSEQSPAFQAYGDSFAGTPPPGAAGEVTRFVRAAIVHQPFDYLAQVGRDAWRIVNPQAPSTVGRGNLGAGYSQQQMIDAQFAPSWQQNAAAQMAQSGFYDPATLAITDHGMGFLRGWERVVRFTGPLMLVVLALAAGAPFVCRRPLRTAAALLSAAGFVLLLTPILTSMYDARYVIPALGPLTAAAGLGAAGVAGRLRMRRATS